VSESTTLCTPGVLPFAVTIRPIGVFMARRKVTLYFEDHRDALRFTLAAGSVMSGAEHPNIGQNVLRIVQPLARATRIRVGRAATDEDDPGSAA